MSQLAFLVFNSSHHPEALSFTHSHFSYILNLTLVLFCLLLLSKMTSQFIIHLFLMLTLRIFFSNKMDLVSLAFNCDYFSNSCEPLSATKSDVFQCALTESMRVNSYHRGQQRFGALELLEDSFKCKHTLDHNSIFIYYKLHRVIV